MLCNIYQIIYGLLTRSTGQIHFFPSIFFWGWLPLQEPSYRAVYSMSRFTMLPTCMSSEGKGTLSPRTFSQNFYNFNLIWHLRLTLFECQWYGGLTTQFTEGWCTWKIISVPQLCYSGFYFPSAWNVLIPKIMLILEQSLQIVVFNKTNGMWWSQ